MTRSRGWGGPRPNSGGARPGAGRPAGEPCVNLTIRVPERLLGPLRGHYGERTAERVRELLAEEVDRLASIS